MEYSMSQKSSFISPLILVCKVGQSISYFVCLLRSLRAFFLKVGGRNDGERELVTSLLETKDTLDTKIAKSQLQIFSNTTPITAEEFEEYVLFMTQ